VIAGYLDFDTSRFTGEHKIKSEQVLHVLGQGLWKREDKKAKK